MKRDFEGLRSCLDPHSGGLLAPSARDKLSDTGVKSRAIWDMEWLFVSMENF